MDLRVKRTLAAIEHAFIDLVISEGFDLVTVQQIADNAQINKKTFYDHFQNKADLLDKLMLKFMNKYQTLLQSRLENQAELLSGKLNIQMQILLTSILDNASLKQLMKALMTIPQLHFAQQVQMMMMDKLRRFQITDDDLAIRVIAAIAFTTLTYYVETGELFSLKRQTQMIQTLETIISPN